MRHILAVGVFSVLSLCVSSAAEDPFNGDWKADQSKVKAPHKGPVTQSLHIESNATSVLIVRKAIDAGVPVQWKIQAGLDGNLVGVLGSPEMDSVRCWRSDPRTILVKMFLQSSNTAYWTAEVAKNGKTLKVTSTVFDSADKEVNTVEWFEKQ